VLFLVGVLLVAIPDGLEIINLTASVLMAIAFIPYGCPARRPERLESRRPGGPAQSDSLVGR